ncbi:MAG: tetratricopeptide repeat protein [Leptolyngbya sp. SIO1E4]|nr:tetratricopeptide repeat protein [Leptolyngbya sp. SIO1E4]
MLPQVDIRTFTGRKKELEQLQSLLIDIEESRVCSIVGLSGGGGIGKSALAAHFATEYQDAFPDGVIGLRVEEKDVNTVARDFILELYKYIGQTLDPEEDREAAVLMKEAFGQLRMLLIFDNADNANALQPLVNAVDKSAIIITTRDRGLPISLNVPPDGIVDVPVLPTSDSLRLLKRIIGENRVNEEVEAANEIIQLVENLPLALQIAGAYLKLQNQRSLSDYAAYLSEEKKRLGRLKFRGNEQLNLRASFELSLKLLQPETVDFFACLSVCGRDGFSRRAAMAAGGLEDEFEAQDLLDPLYQLSLINYAEAGENRFILHSLIHLLAQEIAEVEGIFAVARERHSEFFINLAKASDIENVSIAQEIAEDLDDLILAVDWLSTQEKPEYIFALNLLPIFQRFGYWEKAVDLMQGFQRLAEIREDWYGVVQFRIQQAKYLSLLSKYDEALEIVEPIESTLPMIGSERTALRCEQMWLSTLKGILLKKGLAEEAIAALQRAIDIDEALENSQSLSIGLTALGGVLRQQQRWDEAIVVFQHAVEINETLKNPQQLSISLTALGGVLQQRQRWDEAIEVLQRAVEVAEPLENSQQLSISLNALGGMLQQRQRWDEAIKVLQRAVEVAEPLENSQSLSISLNALGGVLQQRQRWDEAISTYERAAKVAEDLDDLDYLKTSLFHLGNLLQQQQLWSKSLKLLQYATQTSQKRSNPGILKLYLSRLRKFLPQYASREDVVVALSDSIEVAKQLGDPAALRMAYILLGDVLSQHQEWDKATETRHKAVEVAQEFGDKQMIVSSLNSLGDVLLQQERWDEAITVLQRAVEIAETLENSQSLSISLNALGGVLQRRQRWDEAIAALQRAVEVAETLENPQSLSISLNALGGVLQRRQRWDEAIAVLQRAVELAEEQHDNQSLAVALSSQGRTLQLKHQPQDAIPVLLKGLEISEDLEDSRSLGIILNTLGGVYKDLQQWEDSERCFRRCFDLAHKEKNVMGKAIALNGLGQVSEKQGGEKFRIAMAAFRESIKLGEQENNSSHLAKVHTAMGQALFRNEQIEDAIIHLKQSFEIDVASHNQRGVSLIMLYLAPALTWQGRSDEAIQYTQKALEIAPSHWGLLNLYQQLAGTQAAINGHLVKQGMVKFIRRNKTGFRYGYIAPADGSRDVYFREGFIDASVIDIMDVGTLVEVRVKQQAKGPFAESIRILPEIGEVS